MKFCIKCNQEIVWNRSLPKNVQYCKTCNKEQGLIKKRKIDKIKCKFNKSFIIWVKTYLGCAICSEKESCCLDYHHFGNKKYEVGIMCNKAYAFTGLKREIAKCIVLCANCHRKWHQNELGIDDLTPYKWKPF